MVKRGSMARKQERLLVKPCSMSKKIESLRKKKNEDASQYVDLAKKKVEEEYADEYGVFTDVYEMLNDKAYELADDIIAENGIDESAREEIHEAVYDEFCKTTVTLFGGVNRDYESKRKTRVPGKSVREGKGIKAVIVGGELEGTYDADELWRYSTGKTPADYSTHEEMNNQPKLPGYLGPMWGGEGSIRYESPEVYRQLSM